MPSPLITTAFSGGLVSRKSGRILGSSLGFSFTSICSSRSSTFLAEDSILPALASLGCLETKLRSFASLGLMPLGSFSMDAAFCFFCW